MPRLDGQRLGEGVDRLLGRVLDDLGAVLAGRRPLARALADLQQQRQALAVVATFAFVFITSYAIFAAIKATIGLRVTEAEEDAGLDIASHGMYGYPEAFIPQPELPVGEYTPSMAGTPVASSADSPSQA